MSVAYLKLVPWYVNYQIPHFTYPWCLVVNCLITFPILNKLCTNVSSKFVMLRTKLEDVRIDLKQFVRYIKSI